MGASEGFPCILIMPFFTKDYSYRHDKYLVLSTETSYNDIKDCFRIDQTSDGKFKTLHTEDNLAPGLKSFAVAISQPYHAAAFLDHNGKSPPDMANCR